MVPSPFLIDSGQQVFVRLAGRQNAAASALGTDELRDQPQRRDVNEWRSRLDPQERRLVVQRRLGRLGSRMPSLTALPVAPSRGSIRTRRGLST